MNTESINTKCPQCGKHSELILTTQEALEARSKGWYVSCPKCQAAYIHHNEKSAEEQDK
jgi:endogenous inhibitor of DNA gyrase (YacG/DUF329 family)